MTRSLAAAISAKRRRALTPSAASSQPHRAPYWMRRPRTVSDDTNGTGSGTSVTGSTGSFDGADQETVVGGEGDGVKSSAGMSHTHDCGIELAVNSTPVQRTQTSDSHGASSRSTRLASCTKCSDGRKPSGCETSSRVLESSSSEGHSAFGLASGDNVHHRLHCIGAGECASHDADSAAPADCSHCLCPKTSSNTHVDRPWVSTDQLFLQMSAFFILYHFLAETNYKILITC